jgi:pimeloyl-ACP methyl ester carboxylesterase
MPEASTRYGAVNYTQIGAGRPFVLIHGNTYAAATQERLAKRFADEHTVYCLDLLGHGRSARPDGLFSTGYFAMQGAAVADVLAALFPDQAVPVFGMSAGGISALNAICEQPARISALILDGVFRQATRNTVEAHHKSTAGMSETWHRFMRGQHGDEWWPILNREVERTIEELAEAGTVVAPCLEQISVPVLIFQGGKDGFVPDSQAQAVASRIAGSRMVYEAEAGHLIAWRNPDVFRERVRRFLHEQNLV